MATKITTITDQFCISTSTPIWWVVYDSEFWYNKGQLDTGETYTAARGEVAWFDSEQVLREFLRGREQFVSEAEINIQGL